MEDKIGLQNHLRDQLGKHKNKTQHIKSNKIKYRLILLMSFLDLSQACILLTYIMCHSMNQNLSTAFRQAPHLCFYRYSTIYGLDEFISSQHVRPLRNWYFCMYVLHKHELCFLNEVNLRVSSPFKETKDQKEGNILMGILPCNQFWVE